VPDPTRPRKPGNQTRPTRPKPAEIQKNSNMNELVSYCLGSMEPDGIDILGY
jgi:hypothetical protein